MASPTATNGSSHHHVLDGITTLPRRAAQAFIESDAGRRAENAVTAMGLRSLFRLVDLRLRLDPGFRRLILRGAAEGTPDDWCATIGFRARDGAFEMHAVFGGGRVRSHAGPAEHADAIMDFRDAAAARALLTKQPSQVLDMLLTGDLIFEGNMSHVARLSYVLTALKERSGQDGVAARHDGALGATRRSAPMGRCDASDHLGDPGLSAYTIDEFPRLKGFLEDYFSITPAVCTERPRLYTRFFREEGLDPTERGPIPPVLRQAKAFAYLMANRRPIVRSGDLLAGTTTTKDIGVVVYPECGGIPIWPELRTVNRRALNPYRIRAEDERILNEEVFPFWSDRNVREVARAQHNNPRSIQLDERFVLYFQWKTQAVSHTIPGFPVVLQKGLVGIRDEALALSKTHAKRNGEASDKRAFYDAVATSLDGVMAYAAHLSKEAARLAANERDTARQDDLLEIARICAKVPAQPAETLHEAIQAMWTVWVACHMENTNAGLSVGRIDQWLQPYFLSDMAGIAADDATGRRAYIERAIDLVGCFYMRLTDHLPQVADLGNKLFGGSASGQVITLGGVTSDGGNGVNDMTYICLKVTEMLGLKDPNINARYDDEVNSREYLRRLCEVNLLTGATPSLHNDRAVIQVLQDQGLSLEEARDWSATGCVEPTSCGRHYGHTNCMMFNLVAALEMALYDGVHPLIGGQVGPRTGDPRSFETFEDFIQAYFDQLRRLIELATEANNMLGEAHKLVRPTPFLSSLFEGPLESGLDLSAGGARYNSSGTGNVGLVDVVDSLTAVKQLVYDEGRVEMDTMLAALAADFDGYDTLHARIENRVPKFGTGHAESLAIAQRVVDFCHETFRAQPHYRGGHYNSGFWSMSNHVAFGLLSGALPSGRRSGQPFTPGLTPAPGRRASIVEHMHDVAALDHHKMPNNIAFNVKVVPGPDDTQAQAVGHMSGYAEAFMQEGGMQMQFNVVSSQTLRDAMNHPENYRTLMVRISGYNAYFNDLNDDMKRELIARAEHRLGLMRQPLIADIKRNALDDGPGIRTTVFFKGCPLSCVWCHNPESIKAHAEVMYRTEQCIDCKTCHDACVRGAIGEGGAAELNRDLCKRTGHCVDACPAGALEMVGTPWDLDALVEHLLLDKAFYDRSGGGVTLSGGEATLYADYCAALAQRLKARDVHVLLETCGHFEWEKFSADILPSLDVVYVDLKLVDADAHARFCGRDNLTIIANIERLVRHSQNGGEVEVLVRVPLVPGITATPENLTNTASLLGDMGVKRVALLRYNPMWTAKTQGLGRSPDYQRDTWMTEDEVTEAHAAFSAFEVLGS